MKYGFSPQRNGMTGERWRELRMRDDLQADKPPRYFHVSCKAYMAPNPLGVMFPSIPHIDKPGVTYVRGKTIRRQSA